MPSVPLIPPGPHAVAACQAMAACVALCQAGCRLQSVHCHDGRPVIVIDSRPGIPDLRPVSLRVDARGADYHAALKGVMVAWTEPRRRTWPPLRSAT